MCLNSIPKSLVSIRSRSVVSFYPQLLDALVMRAGTDELVLRWPPGSPPKPPKEVAPWRSFLCHGSPIPFSCGMSRQFVDEIVPLLSKPAKYIHHEGDKFEAALFKGYLSQTSVVLTFSHLRGLGGFHNYLVALPFHNCACALRSARGTSKGMPLCRYTKDNAFLSAPGLITMSMLRFKGAPLSTSCFTAILLSTFAMACFSRSCMLTCAPSHVQSRAWIVVIAPISPPRWYLLDTLLPRILRLPESVGG